MYDYAQFHEAVSAKVIEAAAYYLDPKNGDDREDIAFGVLHDGLLQALVACTDDLTPLINDLINVAQDAVTAGRTDLHIPRRKHPAERVGGIPVVGIIGDGGTVRFYDQ